MRGAILISGVSQGFGKSLAKDLVNDHHIIGLSRNEEKLEKLREELVQTGKSFDLISTDVSNYEVTEKKVTSYLNTSEYDLVGLINNAGIRSRKNIDSLSMPEILNVSAINLFGSVNLTKVTLPYLYKTGYGSIINVSSIISQQALPDLSAYAISKGGLDAFTRSMAVELAHKNISVNSILPGFSETPFTSQLRENEDLVKMTLDRIPLGRWGKENEIVGLCRFLLSTEARYITGVSIPVDGGWLA